MVLILPVSQNTQHRNTASVRIKVKVKVKFTLEQATKAQKESRGIALPFL